MYCRIDSVKNLYKLLRYLNSDSHKKGVERNILISTVNMINDNNYYKQFMKEIRSPRRRANHKIEAHSIIISFTEDEFNSNNPADVEKANILVTNFLKEKYPDRRCVVFWQRDGRQGLLHCHAVISDFSITECKGCSRDQQHFFTVKRWLEDSVKKHVHVEVDPKLKAKHKRTKAELAKIDKAKAIKAKHNDVSEEELKQLLIDNKAFSIKEALRNLIQQAIENSNDEKSLFKLLNDKGIRTERKQSKKYGDYYLYNYYSCPVSSIHTKFRSRSLGAIYGPDYIESFWESRDKKKTKTKAQTDAEQFSKWLLDTKQSYFVFDDNGHLLSTDWDKYEVLQKAFEDQKQRSSMSESEQITDDKDSMNQSSFEDLTVTAGDNSDNKNNISIIQNELINELKNASSELQSLSKIMQEERSALYKYEKANHALNINEQLEKEKSM